MNAGVDKAPEISSLDPSSTPTLRTRSIRCPALVCRRSRVVRTPFVFGGHKHKYDIRITPRLVVAFECDHAAFDVSVWDGLPFRVEWKWMHNRGTEESINPRRAWLVDSLCRALVYFISRIKSIHFFYSGEAAAKASSTGSVHSEVIFVYTICVGFVCT